MMKRVTTLTALALVGTLAFAGAATAGEGERTGMHHGMKKAHMMHGGMKHHGKGMYRKKMWGKGMYGGGERAIQMMIRKLELDKAQKEKVWAIYDDIHPKLRSLKDENREFRKTLAEAMKNDASERDISRLAKQQGERVAEQIELKAEMKRRIKSVLTDEQKAKMKENHEKRKDRRKQRRSERQGKAV